MTYENYLPPPGPPPGYPRKGQSNHNYVSPPGPPPNHRSLSNDTHYTPPSGPPPSRLGSNNPYIAPPSCPPPSHLTSSSNGYAPPPGPPPSQSYNAASAYTPPPGPPPSRSHLPQQPAPSFAPPPYHDWTVIPDNSLLPPPPSICYDSSPTANATLADGDAGFAWTEAHPLWSPQHLTPGQHAAIQSGQLSLLKPPEYIGDIYPQQRPGHWKCHTHSTCVDSSLLTSLPLYSVFWDSPLRTQRPKTIYFELRISRIGRGRSSLEKANAGVAVGFVAPPYPTFRLPGWQRGSLAVHGDDGRKYINDTYGGNDFTVAFKPGETVGIGMKFSLPKNPPAYGQQQNQKLDIEVFFTRNGKKVGGWDGNEELDARSEGGTMGLMGECDLFAAVGVFGGLDFEVFFSPEDWVFNPCYMSG
ncbi:hypothetical protein K432DRAFT_302313 [Lepidopterella palustris CBS 459.81]|uniref:SPRY domain-containing protein n=1 Tax=Lepidopterella palustris CBS 459.81 TaxID=1314670 RepID=A0A8E2E6P0_9PEZI|nr:hypothetical protein K432DRAFT_302313 [Lepidopterella palustris CBS 459.81]